MFLPLKHIYPNNLPIWQSVTKPQKTNEYMREVINHSTYIHLLNTIKFVGTWAQILGLGFGLVRVH